MVVCQTARLPQVPLISAPPEANDVRSPPARKVRSPEMPTVEELRSLLGTPSESLSLEYKSWLDLSQNPGKATLAKAAIALSNHGGGIIVLGMREDRGDGGALGSQARPAALQRYSLDDINAAIGRYSDPAFHCDIMFAQHPVTGREHAFVIVPGGMTVPVMCRRACDGVINQHRCYIRKPGPRSEEPTTAEEWRGLLERCVQARRENMLDAIRVIVHGHGSPTPAEPARNALATFGDAARARWRQLIEDLPPDDPARMQDGRFELELEFVGVRGAGTPTETLRRMREASHIKHTGWGPFVLLTRDAFAPRPVDGNVEAWLGHPVEDRARRDPWHCDFWRVHPSGLLFLSRGYAEDSSDRFPPGAILDFTMPIWIIGEALLYASRLARLFDDAGDPDILARCRYHGLRERRLDCLLPGRHFARNRVCNDDSAELQTQATASQIDDNLVEVLHSLLAPLYERFGFYELSRELVRIEIDQLRRNRF